jgi:hypothetical protein
MTAATTACVAAPLLLLPAVYLLWWLDRYRLFPLARFVAMLALAGAVGLLLAASWPAAAASQGSLAGPAMTDPSVIGARAAVLAVDAGRVALAAFAVLVFLLARARIDTPLDGFIFGVAAGVGLALPSGWLLAESVPGVSGLALAGGALAPVAAGTVIGVAVTYARFNPRWAVRLLLALAGVSVAVAVVAGARLAAKESRPWVVPLILAAAIAGALAVALAIELKAGARELAEEARLGVVPSWVPEVLPRYWRRIRASWWGRRDERRALSRLLLQLVFRKHQLRHLDDDRATLYSLEVGRLRERARRLFDPGRTALDGVDLEE